MFPSSRGDSTGDGYPLPLPEYHLHLTTPDKVRILSTMKTAPLPLKPVHGSSFVKALGYLPLAKEAREKTLEPSGFVLVRLKGKRETLAYLVPSWTYGVLMASRSKGRAFNKLLKGKPSVSL